MARSRKLRGGALPTLPLEVIRLIFRRVDYELFTGGDAHLQRYMRQHDMIENAQYVFLWAVHNRRWWTARRLGEAYAVTLPVHLHSMVPLKGGDVATFTSALLANDVEAALQYDVDDETVIAGFRKWVKAGHKNEEVWRLVDKWACLRFASSYDPVLAGRVDLIRQMMRHVPDVFRFSDPIETCLGGGQNQLLMLKALHGFGFQNRANKYRGWVDVKTVAVFRWCVERGYLTQDPELLHMLMKGAIRKSRVAVLREMVREAPEGADLEPLRALAASETRPECLRVLLG